MEYKGEIESTKYPGFYLVPTFSHTYINVKGVVINEKKDFCSIPILVDWGYLQVYAEKRTIFIHRLLALTFLPFPDSVDKLQVNHIDGVKTNNDLSNLEWVTRSENCLHAYQTGLRSDNVPILVKDLQDGTIARYYSLHECARAFNVLPETVFHHLRDYNYGKVSWKYYILIREGQEWPEVDSSEIEKHRNGYPKTIAAVSEDKEKILIFDSISQAAEHFGLKNNTLGMHMRRHGSRPYHGWTFWFMDDEKLFNRQGEVFTRNSHQ